jgi:hypothetical protein
MPAVLHHQPPAPAQAIAQPTGDRWPQRILTLPGLLMQEMRAAQTDSDLGMTAQTHQLLSRILLAAAPTLQPATHACQDRLTGACLSVETDRHE